MSVIITVANIEWPQAGKKQGAVIDSTGKRWGCFPEKLTAFQQFKTYEITFKSNDFKGKTYYTIDSAKLAEGASAPTAPVPGLRMSSGPPLQQSGNPADDQRRMDIFVCGAFNNILSNPNFTAEGLTVEGLAATVEILRRVWKRTLGPQPDPISTGNDMDGDGIPY